MYRPDPRPGQTRRGEPARGLRRMGGPLFGEGPRPVRSVPPALRSGPVLRGRAQGCVRGPGRPRPAPSRGANACLE